MGQIFAAPFSAGDDLLQDWRRDNPAGLGEPCANCAADDL